MPTFYRVVKANPPGIRDFLSGKILDRTPPADPNLLPLWDGISVFDTEDRARQRALRVPSLGEYIAAMEIPDDGSIRYERSLNRPGHYTLWADADALLALVVSVVPAQRARAPVRGR